MSKEKLARTKKALMSAPAGILGHDPLVASRQKQARRPPAMAKTRQCPLVLLLESREPVRVALKILLERSGCDVIAAAKASDALSIAAANEDRIDFLITHIVSSGINSGLLSYLFQCRHPETRVLFVSGSREEVLICDELPQSNINVLEQPVPIEIVAETVSRMIRNLQG